MWLYLGIFSAFFLGLYDVCKKHAVKENAVLPVLFIATLFGSMLMLPVIILSFLMPEKMMEFGFYVPFISLKAHGYIFIKACIVSSSWIFAYFALKHLPISIATPIRASGPLWTLIGAVLLFHESPSMLQWFGLAVILFSYYLFTLLGLKEGIHFGRNKWVMYIILATILGTISGLYDKYLLQNLDYEPLVLQAWFSVYLVLILGGIVLLFWLPQKHKSTPFHWQWSIPMIGILLIVADFFYFRALSYDNALIALLSAIRRTSVLVSFGIGSRIFHEVNIPRKSLALTGVLAGVFMILWS